MSANMKRHGFDGDLFGGGIAYGYRWSFAKHWGVEATVALGYAHLSYDKKTIHGHVVGHYDKNYVGPTEVGINMIYQF